MTNEPNDVRVSRELLERLFSEEPDGYLTRMNARQELLALLAQPADQQGEPEGFITHGPDPVTGNELVHRWTHLEQAERHIRGIDGLNGWKITRLYRHAQPATAKVDELSLFSAWKGYPLPELNADGQFDKEYLQREWVAWQARAKLNTPQ